MHDVGCEKHQLEEGNIRGPDIGWDFIQRVIVDELPDVFLDGCPHTVEAVGSGAVAAACCKNVG